MRGVVRPKLIVSSLLLAWGLMPAAAAELPYVNQVRKGSAGGPSRVIVAPSAKLELVMLVAARADRQQRINPPRQDNQLGNFWNARSQAFGFDEAPRHLRALREHGLWGDRLLEFALHLSDPPRLERVLPWSENLLEAARGESAEDPESVLDTLLTEMRSLAGKMRFSEHFAEQQEDYKGLAGNLKLMLGERDPMAENASFWGSGQVGDLYLIPSPIVTGGHLASLEVAGRVVSFLAFGPVIPGVPISPNMLDHLLYHELSHLLVDPKLTAASGQLETSAALWPAVARHFPNAPYLKNWTDGIGEHLMRAYNIHLLRNREPVMAELSVTMEEEAGFLYTRSFLGMLEDYAAGREQWPSFEDYLPVMAGQLKEMAGRSRDLDPQTQSPEFELQNGGFEATGGGWMAREWSLVRAGELPGGASGDFTEVQRDASVARSGDASLRLQNRSDTIGLVAVEQGPLAVRAGGTVRASCWIKASEVRRDPGQQKVAGIYVLFLDKAGEVLSRGESDSAVGTLDWTRLQAEFVAPPGTARARLGILLGMSGTAWFDDMAFERVD